MSEVDRLAVSCAGGAVDAGAADFVVNSSPDVLDARLRVALRSYPTQQATPSLIRADDGVERVRHRCSDRPSVAVSGRQWSPGAM